MPWAARLDRNLDAEPCGVPHRTLAFCSNLPARHRTIAIMQSTMPLASVERLDLLHRDAITAAVLRLLDTALVRETFGQIVDGLPLCHIAYGQRGHRLYGEHPILRHVTLCPGVEEALAKFRSDFDMGELTFSHEVDDPILHVFWKSRSPLTLHSYSILSKTRTRVHAPSTYA